jgi:hypothetical protein
MSIELPISITEIFRIDSNTEINLPHPAMKCVEHNERAYSKPHLILGINSMNPFSKTSSCVLSSK